VNRFATLCLAVVFIFTGVPVIAGSLTPDLKEAILSADPGDLLPVVVLMEEFPARDERLAAVRGFNREDRRAHVVSAMQDLAGRSQKQVRTLLAAEPQESRNVRVLWGINGVALDATPRVLDLLAALPEVRWILHDSRTGRPATGMGATGPTGGDASGPNPEAAVRGEVIAMGARQVWDELGYTGAGVIVAVLDSGIDRDHPDLADHIWTNLGELPDNGLDDDGNGYIDDTWGWDLCQDDNTPTVGSHGTQVAGQVAGDGTNGTVTGMAPDVELMSLDIGCSPEDTLAWEAEASDYAIANGAHIISMSYAWLWTDPPYYTAWRRQSDTELAAGVIRVNAGGNEGGDFTSPVPYNIVAPANCPPPWLHPDQTLVGGVSSTIAVGNISYGTDLIMSHSSRGPSAWEDITIHTNPNYPFPIAPEYMDYPYEDGVHMGLLKPDISAYGNGTYSTCPGNSYCQFSGTSSATPHVSGVLALMLQSNPEATPAELTEAILTSAEHRGDPGKNNVYGVGLVQAYEAVTAIESGVLYDSHTIDDTAEGNGDLAFDPGERVVMPITVQSRTDVPVEGLEAILSTTTPGVTIHNRHATYSTVPARGIAISSAPHYSLTVAPGACSTVIVFDLELRYQGKVRRSTFPVRIGDETPAMFLEDDFETDLGWSSDPGVTTQGAFVREDPIGVLDSLSRLANPEDDTSDPGVTCWVTGNGELNGRKDEDNNDVDGGAVTLLSPPFGEPHILALDLSYDRWYYDVDGGNSFRAEVSTDGGLGWTLLEEIPYGAGGWENHAFDLLALVTPSDDMRLRFVVTDDGTDDPVEGAIDEVVISGTWVDCEGYTPDPALAPYPVGDTLAVDKDPNGHAVLTWGAPPVDGGHDTATIYRVDRETAPSVPFTEAGSATVTRWVDIDALGATEPYYYLVRAENAGGGSD